MNVGDILIDMPLLEEQYHFLLRKYEIDLGLGADQYDEDMWEGVMNLFETILEFRTANTEEL